MNRRRFAREALAGGALAVGAGSALFARRAHAREAMASSLLNDALPPLASNATKDLDTLPMRARDEIKRFFHGKCLNVEGFVSLICSTPFVERLGRCRMTDEKEACLLQAFCARVATENEILHQIEVIASEAGNELDGRWSNYCSATSLKWNARIPGNSLSVSADKLTSHLSEFIRTELREAALKAASGPQRPAVSDTLDKIGQSAFLLLPLCEVKVIQGPPITIASNPLVLPVFLILAVRHVWDYVLSRLDDRRGDFQAAISSRMALLGIRVASEFEREIRQRIVDLHIWQERSIRTTADLLARERAGFIRGIT